MSMCGSVRPKSAVAKGTSPWRRVLTALVGLVFIVAGLAVAAPDGSSGAAALFAIAAALVFVGGFGLYSAVRREDSGNR